MRRLIPIILTLALAASACALPVVSTPTPILTATQAPSDTPLPPSETPSLTPVPSPTQTFTPSPFAPFMVTTGAANVNLRSEPSYLFPVLRIMPEGTPLTVLGKAPGGEWFRVKNSEDIFGWAFGMLLQSGPDLQAVPVIEPTDVRLLRGRVTDSSGTLIRGVSFNISQGSGNGEKRNTVLTDAEGVFYSYMPMNVSGTWTVGVNGITCDSNVWQDTICANYKPGYQGEVEPNCIDVMLPSDDILEFKWK